MAEPEEEKERLVSQYLAAAAAGGPAKDLARAAAALDGLYWKMVEEILRRGINVAAGALKFSDDDRLLLDFGLLDERLVKGAPPALRDELLKESALVGAPNHFYLSEWLADRFKRYQTESAFAGTEAGGGGGAGDAYQTLQAFLARQNDGAGVKLPGVSPVAMEAMFSGRLDRQIIAMGVSALANRNRRDFLTRARLSALRREVVARSRGAVGDSAQLRLFDAIDEAYRQEWEIQLRESGGAVPLSASQAIALQADPAKEDAETLRAFNWLLSELRFVRTLMPLGALAGGLFRPCAAMLEYRPRVTRAHTAAVLGKVAWCDRNYQLAPVVLIAPFTGRGIYEWDRDSLVISLTPVENPEDSAANAVANFSMMIDSFQHHAALKDAYRAMFTGANFQKSFQADYRTWVCGVAGGRLDALPPDKLEFFATQVAPDFAASPVLALAPRELRNLTFTARELVRKQMQRLVSTARDSWMSRWRLGILYWMDGLNEEALRELTHAANLAPAKLETYFAVACLLAQMGRPAKARPLFNVCATRGKNTIWALHAARAAAALLPPA